jgi:hypothetical protein
MLNNKAQMVVGPHHCLGHQASLCALRGIIRHLVLRLALHVGLLGHDKRGCSMDGVRMYTWVTWGCCLHAHRRVTDVCCRVAAGRPACDPRSSYYARSSYSCTDYGLILTHACGGSARAYDRTARTVRTKKCTRHARGEMGGQLGQQARKVRDVVFWPSLRPVLVSRSHQVCDSGWACCGQPVAKVRLPLLTFRPLRVKMLY